MALALAVWVVQDGLLYYRDNFSTHYPVKSITREIVGDGLPLWNPHVGGGQPLAGNPNNLTFYPTTLLFLFLPAHVAFNLHFLLHLVVAWFGMRRLLRLHDLTPEDASRVSWLYLFSGTTISCLVFYNLIVAAAMMPWALAALIRLLDRRSATDGLFLGCFCGLIGLAAEPFVVIGFTMLAISLLVARFSVRALPPILLAVAVSAAIAMPQLIAYSEVSGETERAHYSYGSEWALVASLGPDRLAEIVTGPVFGSVLDHSPRGYWANQSGRRWPPFFLSIMLSALVLPAVLRGRRDRLLRYQIPVVLFLAIGLGRFNPAVRTLFESYESIGVIRYPEKLALPLTLVGSVLIGILFRDLRRDPKRFRPAAGAGIGAMIVLAVVVLVSTDLGTAAAWRLAGVSALQTGVLVILLIPDRITSLARTLALLALAPLVFWSSMIIPIDRAGYYTLPSPVAAEIGRGTPIEVTSVNAAWNLVDSRTLYRFYAFRLNPVFGLRFGIPYVLTGSPEGMHSYLSRLSSERSRAVEPEVAIKYLRINGAAMTVRADPLSVPGTRLRDRWRAWPDRVFLYEIDGARPLLWEPSSVVRVGNANEAVETIESDGYDPGRDTVVPSWLDESIDPGGRSRVGLLSRTSQRLSFSIESEAPTIVVVNQTWFSAWRAWAGDRELTTFPADIDRLGIVIPAGRSIVDLAFGRNRAWIGGALVVSISILLYSLGLAIWSSSRTAVPAR